MFLLELFYSVVELDVVISDEEEPDGLVTK